eukprot:354275-Chlamydomonas_euryale.AAC.8
MQNDEFLRLAINGIHTDLTSRNEAFECLALNFVGTGACTVAQRLCTRTHQRCFSRLFGAGLVLCHARKPICPGAPSTCAFPQTPRLPAARVNRAKDFTPHAWWRSLAPPSL